MITLVEIDCEARSKSAGNCTGKSRLHSAARLSSSPSAADASAMLCSDSKIVELRDVVTVRILCIADSAAVASTRILCFSITDNVMVLGFRFFVRGEKKHFTGNLLPKGIFESGIVMQYWISWSDCLSMVYMDAEIC